VAVVIMPRRRGHLLRPLLSGPVTYLVFGDRWAVFTERWPLVIGLIFMAFVLFLPKGIWGTLVDKLPGGGSAGVKP
jgi:ABC-type branched-subunit amino acid transport system permease subunit